MTQTENTRIVSAVLAFFLTAATAFGGAKVEKKPAHLLQSGRIPDQILTAKSIFISNAGAACIPCFKSRTSPLFAEPLGCGDYAAEPNRPYQKFYDAMESWGHFKVAAEPEKADLDFEIALKCSAFSGGSYDVTQLQLAIRDVKTRMLLWVENERIGPAVRELAAEENFDNAVARLVSDVKALAETTPVAASAKSGK